MNNSNFGRTSCMRSSTERHISTMTSPTFRDTGNAAATQRHVSLGPPLATPSCTSTKCVQPLRNPSTITYDCRCHGSSYGRCRSYPGTKHPQDTCCQATGLREQSRDSARQAIDTVGEFPSLLSVIATRKYCVFRTTTVLGPDTRSTARSRTDQHIANVLR